jgi:hypothetical protein
MVETCLRTRRVFVVDVVSLFCGGRLRALRIFVVNVVLVLLCFGCFRGGAGVVLFVSFVVDGVSCFRVFVAGVFVVDVFSCFRGGTVFVFSWRGRFRVLRVCVVDVVFCLCAFVVDGVSCFRVFVAGVFALVASSWLTLFRVFVATVSSAGDSQAAEQ